MQCQFMHIIFLKWCYYSGSGTVTECWSKQSIRILLVLLENYAASANFMPCKEVDAMEVSIIICPEGTWCIHNDVLRGKVTSIKSSSG